MILTPHIAWRSNQSLDALQEAAVDRARKALTGHDRFDFRVTRSSIWLDAGHMLLKGYNHNPVR